jgi:DNA-binding transcriptional MerR regulator
MPMTINEISVLCGLSPHTLRYYEKVGLLLSVARKPNGHRSYTEQDLAWIEFLKRLKETGMLISDMQKFALLRSKGDESIIERQKLLLFHREKVQNDLERIQSNLENITIKINLYEKLASG